MKSFSEFKKINEDGADKTREMSERITQFLDSPESKRFKENLAINLAGFITGFTPSANNAKERYFDEIIKVLKNDLGLDSESTDELDNGIQ